MITGANKGIGHAIAQTTLQKNLNFDIMMCSRDKVRGEEAIHGLTQKFPDYQGQLKLGMLDVNSATSIQAFSKSLESTNTKVDVLVNNAGILRMPKKETDYATAAETFGINYWGAVNTTTAMLPSMNDKSKILFMGSIVAHDAFKKCSDQIQYRMKGHFSGPEEINSFAQEYLDDVQSGDWKDAGYHPWELAMSKLFIQVYCSALGRSDEITQKGIQCYTMHPGVIASDQNGHNKKYRPTIDGARSTIGLIEKEFEIDEDTQGGFFHEDGSFLELGDPFKMMMK